MALRLFLGVFLVIGSNLLQLTSTGSAHAAGFNCQSARSPLEKRICDDATLSRADELLAHVYRAQLAATPMELRQRLRESQRSWLAYIGPYCSIPADHRRQCLRDGFADRTKELGATMRKVGGKSFFQTWAYAVAFDQDRPDRAFANKIEFLQIARPKNQSDRQWNQMVATNLIKAAKAEEDNDDLDVWVQMSGASNDLISTRFATSYYSGSMPHPQSYSHAIVWSLRLARPLTFADLFKDVQAGKERLAEEALGHFEGGAPDGATRATVLKTLDYEGVWEATPAGILLDYDPYAFGCYPCTGRAVVPWSDLASDLRADLPFSINDLRD